MLSTPFAQAATPSPSPSAAAPVAELPALTPEQQGIQDAAKKAKASGKPVVVDALTSETSQTVVNPNGRLTTSTDFQPVRTKRGNGWANLDATLHKNADGTISPAVTSNGLSLSGGGSGPVATITTSDSKKLAVTAPFALPAPTLSGAVATYANVLPDVDLQVTALTNGGWRDVIVVKTAAAAANPKLAKLHFPLSTTGLKVGSDSAGNVSLTDSSGKVRLQAPTPTQWDSSTAPAAPAAPAYSRSMLAATDAAATPTVPVAKSSAAGPGDQAVQTPIAIQAGDTGIDLTPDPKTFGKGTGPWYLDPTVSVNSSANAATQVQEYYPNSQYYSTAQQDLGTGYCGYSSCPSHGRERAYFQIPVSSALYTQPSGAPAPPTVYSSQLIANVDGASSPTTSTPLGLYSTGVIGSGTTWNNQPCNTGSTMGGCTKVGDTSITGTGNILYDVSSQMQQAVAGKWPTWTVGIAPDDENNMYYRHHIASNAQINTTYDLTPSIWYQHTTPQPGFANADGNGNPAAYDCTTGGANPWTNPGWIGANQSINLTVSAWSPINANLTDNFHIWDDNNSSWGQYPSTAAPSYGSASVSMGSLTDGHQYGWNASSTDGTLTSAATSYCYFRVDKTPPTASVSSADFPPSGTPNPNPTKFNTDSGTFTITGNDPAPVGGGASSGLACFKVSTSSTPVTGWHCNDPAGASGTVLPASNGSANYSYVPGKWGTNTLYVQAQDNAGNYSQPTAYNFYAPWNPASTPKFGDVTGDGKPDILLPDGTGNLRLVQNTGDPVNAGWISSVGASAPAGLGSWNGLQVTHRGSLRGQQPVDDLIVHAPGAPLTYLYVNNGTGGYNAATSFYLNGTTTPGPITCNDATGAAITCPSTLGTDWSGATQLLAFGSPDGETTSPLSKTSLLAVINKQLWLFPPGATSVRLLSKTGDQLSTTDWTNYDLIGPGPANGTTSCTNTAGTTVTSSQATLWVRDRSTGNIISMPITKNADCTNNYAALANPATTGTVIGTGYDPVHYPTVSSVGDLTGDGVPDLYGQTAAGKLVIWSGVVGDTVNHPGVVTGFGTSNSIGDPRAPLGRYLLAGPTSSTDTAHTPDLTGQHPATVNGDVSFGATTIAGAATSAAVLNSSAASTGTAITATANTGEVDAPGLQVDTTKSFTLSTWARADQLSDGVVLSQDGAQTSNFMLWRATDSTGSNWRFAMATADGPGLWPYDQTTAVINTNDRVQPGAWTKLVVSYDATTGEMAVYVNGALAATGMHTNKIAATGSLVVGRYLNNGAKANPFQGAVADVSVFPFPTTPAGTTGPIVSGISPTKCVDDANAATADGNPVDIYDCNGTAAQAWTAKDDGTVQVFGKCLDIVGASTANHALVDLSTCTGGASQQWIPRADGTFLNPVSGRCLDETNNLTTNGTQLQLYDCWGTPTQYWTPTPLS